MNLPPTPRVRQTIPVVCAVISFAIAACGPRQAEWNVGGAYEAFFSAKPLGFVTEEIHCETVEIYDVQLTIRNDGTEPFYHRAISRVPTEKDYMGSRNPYRYFYSYERRRGDRWISYTGGIAGGGGVMHAVQPGQEVTFTIPVITKNLTAGTELRVTCLVFQDDKGNGKFTMRSGDFVIPPSPSLPPE